MSDYIIPWADGSGPQFPSKTNQQPTPAGNPLDGLGQFIGDTLGFVTGGVLPDSKGQHRGPLAEAVQLLFGDNPWEAERYPDLIAKPKPTSGLDPANAANPPPVRNRPSAPREPSPVEADAPKAAVTLPDNDGWFTPEGRAAALSRPAPEPVPGTVNDAIGGPVTDSTNAARAAAVAASGKTQDNNPSVAIPRNTPPDAYAVDPKPKIWVWQSDLDALKKPPGSLPPKREMLAAPKRVQGALEAYEAEFGSRHLDNTGLPDFSNGGRSKDDRRIPASVRHNNPAASWPAKWMQKYGMQGHSNLNDGQGNKIAYFPNAVLGAAANFELMQRVYAGMDLRAAIRKWSGNNSPDQYAAIVARKLGISKDTVITEDMIRNPDFAIPMFRAMAGHEAGRKGSINMTDKHWRQAHALFIAKT